MSKKNKKNTKINQRIKKYFDDDPFDVGIERVESEVLSELFHYLGIYEVAHSKELLVKTARMVWSEADSSIRKLILEFFANNKKIYVSNKPKEPEETTLEKIDELLQEYTLTNDEVTQIYGEFASQKAKKITADKIYSKLQYIRHEQKMMKLQKAVDGIFDIDDSLEFNADIHYVLLGQSFHKIHTINTKKYEYKHLQETDIEELVKEIKADKESAKQSFQKRIDEFISSIPSPHTILSDKEIVSSLRSSPPKAKQKYPLIKEDILNELISKHLSLISLDVHNEELMLGVEEYINLPYSEERFKYKLDLHIEINSFLESVWRDEELDFDDVLHEAKTEHEKHFLEELAYLVNECKKISSTLKLSDADLYNKIYEHLLDILPTSLIITPKISRKVQKRFIYSIQGEIIKAQKHALLAQTIRDFKNLFPLARSIKRKLILHIGPTNSGKTYQAMQSLKEADTGYYLAPLRLLALEGYEGLKDDGVDVSLITGEEQIIDADATHISSTIEMLNFEVDVDVCVIDEVQMIGDSERGWAWANAIIGAPANEIIMTGSPNSKEAVIALAEYLGEELEIIEFERKNPLKLLPTATNADDVQKGSAIIAFSRKDVLRLKQNFSKQFDVSVVYGNLSPEVRREEARRFREGETDLLIATDAIAMGLNLPIKTLLFSKAVKFDGNNDRELTASEIHQISGRAGRYGLNEEGYVGALYSDVLKIIHKNFYKEAKKIEIPFKVMANLGHIQLVASILEEKSLYEILKFFVKNMEFNGPFIASNLEDMLEASKITDEYDLDIATKYHLSCAPITLKSPYIVSVFESYIRKIEQKHSIDYIPPQLIGKYAKTTQDLLLAEDMVKEISLYLWLSYRFGDYFLDQEKARRYRATLNKYIENSLHQSGFVQSCKMCGATLPPNTKYNICNSCYKKNYGIKNRKRNRRY
ncbi:helicase [Sulfurimonas lithotrophica]|uniref:RNA helicase n=1 Tax=Sulfurimonas lithotrophica TaxID=2590022 RepID=A0A5P8NXZ8_9BACT|nr:SUV3 C-terminal domain-containing protein [Sulfurimonas lithotrophica]QFR48287.1 helicase [Sulfurimonas lithotrophica]